MKLKRKAVDSSTNVWPFTQTSAVEAPEKTGVCIYHTGTGTGGPNTNGVRGEGNMSSTSSLMR